MLIKYPRIRSLFFDHTLKIFYEHNKRSYYVLGLTKNAYYFFDDSDTDIYGQFLSNNQMGIKTSSLFNQKHQKIVVPRNKPSVEQIQKKFQNEWKNKKIILNIDPSALIGLKRLFMKNHLQKNIYKGINQPINLFNEINPSSEISTEELKFDEQNFLMTDPLAIKIMQQNQNTQQDVLNELITSELQKIYTSQSERFCNRLQSILKVPQSYQKIIQIGMCFENQMYFCGINQYSLRNLLSKYLTLAQVKEQFMGSMKYSQSESYKYRLMFPGINQKLQHRYNAYARQYIYLKNFKIINKIQKGQIVKRVRSIQKHRPKNQKGRMTKSGVFNKKDSSIIIIGQQYTIQNLEQYTLIQDLQSHDLMSKTSKISSSSLNSVAPLQKQKIKDKAQTDSQKIEKHAILEVMLGDLWNQPYTFNKYPYLSQSYRNLNEQDKQQVKQLYHSYLAKYTGAKKLFYQQNINNMQSIEVNSPQFIGMRGKIQDEVQQFANLRQQKLKAQNKQQIKNEQLKNKQIFQSVYSDYKGKNYEQSLEQLSKIKSYAKVNKQEQELKQASNQLKKSEDNKKQFANQNTKIGVQKARRPGRAIKAKKSQPKPLQKSQ